MGGAVINIVLNLLLIPKMGAQGAAIATVASYLLVFAIRAVNTRRYVPFSLSLPRMIVSILLLAAQSVLILVFENYIIITQSLLFALICAINLRPVIKGTVKMLRNRKKV